MTNTSIFAFPRILIALAAMLLFVPRGAAAQAGEEVLSNQTVVSMVVGKLSKDLILAKVSSTKNEFDLSVSAIVALHQNKVHVDIIRAMAAAAEDAALGRPGSNGREVISNQSIVSMVSASVNKALISNKITTARNEFDVSVTGIVNLHQSKVSADLITAMISAASDATLGRPDAVAAEVLTNESVVSMVVNKVPRQIILTKIQNTKANFDVSAAGMVSLNGSKVPQDVIKAMIIK